MNLDTIQLEEELEKLAPARLSDSLLDRLDAAVMEASEMAPAEEKILVASSDSELSALEEGLRDLVPYGVPEDMISRLDEAMSRWHEEVPVEEKVVSIHPESVAKKSGWLGLRSVAAVGLLGAGVALMTSGGRPPVVADHQVIPDLSNGNASPIVFTSNNAGASVVSANDHGVIWTKAGKPVRCMEVHVMNRVLFVNEKGERLIIEQPKREVRFTPVKFD